MARNLNDIARLRHPFSCPCKWVCFCVLPSYLLRDFQRRRSLGAIVAPTPRDNRAGGGGVCSSTTSCGEVRAFAHEFGFVWVNRRVRVLGAAALRRPRARCPMGLFSHFQDSSEWQSRSLAEPRDTARRGVAVGLFLRFLDPVVSPSRKVSNLKIQHRRA